MCEQCAELTRRTFLKRVVIGGTALGLGLHENRPAMAETARLKFSTWHPPLSRETKTVWTPMLDQMKKKSGGNLDYTLYAGGALGKAPEHYDIVAKGLSDMGYFTATFTPGRFPLTDVLSLAAWVDGKDLAVDIGNAVYDRILKDEFKDVKVLELNGCIQSYIWTKKSVAKMEDLKGLKLRTPGGHQTNYIKILGAEPVFMPPGDVYMAIETGTIDGIVTCPPVILAFKLHEVAKYGVVTTLGCVSEGLVMNMNTWNKLPEDQKKIVNELGANPFRTSGGLTRSEYPKLIEEITKGGVEMIELPRGESRRWHERFQEVTRKWTADLEAKGLPARKAVAIMNEECEKRDVQVVACPPELKKI
ncbi:MAG TPA: TRAP transporter substrate-binding protein DctP [Desulfobacterales bacterium]|nr:TRAP transporter substrate-binding protein DctP [Desulfobacterales bacterium]